MKTFGLSRPHPYEVICGDAWIAIEKPDGLRVALIDGSGHGEAASEVAAVAVDSLRATVNESVPAALMRMHLKLHGTRGAAVTIADISDDTLLFAGAGNVEGRLLGPSREKRIVPQRGIVGVVMPTIRPEIFKLEQPDWSLLLYSDGVSSRLAAKWDSVAPEPEVFITSAIDQWGRLTDDATIVVVLSS